MQYSVLIEVDGCGKFLTMSATRRAALKR